MESFTKLLTQKTSLKNSEIVAPAAIYSVVDKTGKQLYLHASGSLNGREEGNSTVNEDSVCWMASQTKLMTTVAAMQCVEKGLIGLDDDIAPILPDLASLEVLDGTLDENGKLRTRKRQNKITLRLLLSHQSGVGYDLLSPELVRWLQEKGISNTTMDNTMWAYGAGIDWAGELVARLNKTTLETYMRENVWGPLEMFSTTYHPEERADFSQRTMVCFMREEATTGLTPIPSPIPMPTPKECGGHGSWSTIKDYSKLLHALLTDGGLILSKESADEILKPQMRDRNKLKDVIQGPLRPALGQYVSLETDVDHGLAGLVTLEDMAGRRRAGSLQWSGAANLIWWVDRTSGIAATGFLQIMPPGDPKATELHLDFERAVYQAFG